MVDFSQVVDYLVWSILAGAVGTGGLTLTLFLVTKSGVTNARMVVAVGSLFTKSLDSADRVGTILHGVSGIIFGMLYTLVMIAPEAGLPFAHLVWIGGGLGFIHGLMVCFFLVAMIAEAHPLKEFQSAGVAVGLAHLLGHIVYGFLVGLMIAVSGIATP